MNINKNIYLSFPIINIIVMHIYFIEIHYHLKRLQLKQVEIIQEIFLNLILI